MELEFDEEKHIYSVAGVAIPSVTEILKYHKAIPFPAGPYKTRGRAVHRATQLWDEGNDVKVGDKVAGYLESYKAVMAEYKFKWEHVERRLWHKKLLYAGTLDREGFTCSGDHCIADLKSGETGDETELQVAGYELLKISWAWHDAECGRRSTTSGIRRFRIRLYEDGKPGKVTEYKNPLAIDAFIGYLSTYKWENRGK